MTNQTAQIIGTSLGALTGGTLGTLVAPRGREAAGAIIGSMLMGALSGWGYSNQEKQVGTSGAPRARLPVRFP